MGQSYLWGNLAANKNISKTLLRNFFNSGCIFHFVMILIISQCSDIIFALYKIAKSIIKLSIHMYIMLPEYACELFFYKLHIEN